MLKNRIFSKKFLLCLLCAFLCIAGFGGISLYLYGSDAEEMTGYFVDGQMISENYYMGETLNIPDYVFPIDNEQVVANHALYLPDGNVISSNNIVIDMPGEYILKYNAYSGRKNYFKNFTFYVCDPLYEIKGNNGSIAYWGDSGYGEGVLASLKRGDVFYFNKPIDLEKCSDSGFIKLFNLPHAIHQYDGELMFKLTDAQNEDNALYIKLYKYPYDDAWTYTGSYLSVSTDGNKFYSLRPYDTKKPNNSSWITLEQDIIDGRTIYYYWETNATYGSPVMYSMVGTPKYRVGNEYVVGDMNDLYNNQLDICLDIFNKTVYSQCGKKSSCPFVVDFDGSYYTAGRIEKSFFDTEWGGFSSNEVKLSIYPASLKTQSFDLVITEIGGLTAKSLSVNTLKDYISPELSVETEYDLNNLPNAIVGYNYEIPKAFATDNATEKVLVRVNVYRNYFSENKIFCPVVDGKVKINMLGRYFIEYTAIDNSGNRTVKVIFFDALSDREEDFTADVSGYVTEVYLGEKTKILEDVLFNGAIGNTKYYLKATHQNSGIEEIITDNFFRPLYKGQWDIDLYYSDCAGDQVLSLDTLNVIGENKTIILNNPVFEKFCIKNAKYVLPEIEPYLLSENKPVSVKDYTVEVKEGDSTVYVKIDKPSAYIVGDYEKVQFRYRRNEETLFETDVIPVVDVNFSKNTTEMTMENYFVGNASRVKTDNGIEMTASADFAVEFIRKIQIRDLSLQICLFENAHNFTEFTICFVSVQDSSKKIAITFDLDMVSGYLFYTVNGGQRRSYARLIDVGNQFNTDIVLTLNIKFSKEKGVSVQQDVYEKVNTDGFIDDFAFLQFDGSVESGNFKFSVKNINGQQFNVQKDRVKPQILYSETDFNIGMGSSFELKGALMFDVLDPYITTEFYVLSPSGKYVVADDGTTLDKTANFGKNYVITPKEYGRYTICYTVKDTLNAIQEIEYTVLVYDIESPKVVLDGVVFDGSEYRSTIKQQAKKGEKLSIKNITYEDNLSENLSVYIFYKAPDGVLRTIDDDKVLYLDYFGLYTVYYHVMDENGNATIAYYYICAEN